MIGVPSILRGIAALGTAIGLTLLLLKVDWMY
jgi:hypothetical protein